MIFLLVLISYRAISLVSKMRSFFFQLAAVFILRTEKWGMVIENFQRMGHFSCFQLHFFQLWKAKLVKYQKVGEKWLFIPFPPIFCYNLAKNQLLNIYFFEKCKDFLIFDPPNAKILRNLTKKDLQNLMQASVINKNCWVLA